MIRTSKDDEKKLSEEKKRKRRKDILERIKRTKNIMKKRAQMLDVFSKGKAHETW